MQRQFTKVVRPVKKDASASAKYLDDKGGSEYAIPSCRVRFSRLLRPTWENGCREAHTNKVPIIE